MGVHATNHQSMSGESQDTVIAVLKFVSSQSFGNFYAAHDSRIPQGTGPLPKEASRAIARARVFKSTSVDVMDGNDSIAKVEQPIGDSLSNE